MHKSELEQILMARDWKRLMQWWCGFRGSQRALLTAQFHPDRLIKWRALEALGWICHYIYHQNPPRVRAIIRHFLWGMNYESGNLIWHAPEALSEIFVRLPLLIDEYGLITASHIEQPAFARGLLFFLARLSPLNGEIFQEYLKKLSDSLLEDDEYIRVFSAAAVHNLAPKMLLEHIALFNLDHRIVELYNFRRGTVDQWQVSKAVELIILDNYGDYF